MVESPAHSLSGTRAGILQGEKEEPQVFPESTYQEPQGKDSVAFDLTAPAESPATMAGLFLSLKNIHLREEGGII